ncbi:hypothetical protein ABZZ16_02250 [Streptomyces sp. NPDC006386]|uniref:hypothetical protein n=1 Tax=Streptomyces sp. NPDC006386 TaxID=3156762 RepID=UPI0033B52EF2
MPSLLSAPTAPPYAVPRRSSPHRSPYGIPTPLDGTASALVRPYLATHEPDTLDRHLDGEQKAAA